MTTTTPDEYRQLGYDTTNDMIRYDARRGDGLYEQAALHIRQAGFGRARMGQMRFAAGDHARAAAHWLSAAACFLLVPDAKRMREYVERVRQLDREGKIPPERRDIHAALKEREEELRTLEERIGDFVEGFTKLATQAEAGSQKVLDYLLSHVRELTGFPGLHFMICYQARMLGKQDIEAEHAHWAWAFDPDNATTTMLLGGRLLEAGQPDKAITLAQNHLADHPSATPVRVMLAQALAWTAGGRVPDLEGALAVLCPVIEDDRAGKLDRLGALGLSAAFHYELKHPEDARRLTEAFDRLAGELQSPGDRQYAAELRRVLPHPGVNGTSTATGQNGHPAEADRVQLYRVMERRNLSLVPAVA